MRVWAKRVKRKRIGRRPENIEAASGGGERMGGERRGGDAGEFLNHSSEVRSVGGENGGGCSS